MRLARGRNYDLARLTPFAAVLLPALALVIMTVWLTNAAGPPETSGASVIAGGGTDTPTPSPGPTPAPFSNALSIPPVITSQSPTISMEEACIQILPGPCTNMWTYDGIFPGPTIRRPTGQSTYVTFENNLPPAAGDMTIHHHGNHSSSQNDGQPHHHLIPPGDSMVYTYEHMEDGSPERGATQWYHDHRMDVTGRNVWNGLAGMYILDDPADPAGLPSGAHDIPLMLFDRQFDAQNQIPYFGSSNGEVGQTLIVNGVHQPYLEVGDRKYRFRILDASNARVYELGLDNGISFTQVGSESGLLPAPVSRAGIVVSPSERVDVVIDFSGYLGQTFFLRDNRSENNLLQFRVTQDVTDTSTVPATLRPVPDLGTPTVTRTFTFSRQFANWVINGQVFDPNRIDAQPLLGSTETWILKTSTLDGGALHTVHIHGVDQQCLTRNGQPCQPWEAAKEAWLMQPGDTLEVKLKFSDHQGKFMFHCHFLEHEDHGMMAQFDVVDTTPTPTATPTATPTPTPTPTPTETPPPNLDNDGDGVANGVEVACGSDPGDDTSLPERVDGVFAGEDEDGDALVDEPLPGAAAGSDCDGDGYTGTAETTILTPASDRDQDPCGGDGWPSNMFNDGLSANKLDIQDIASFVLPVRRLDSNPPGGDYSARWDLSPGPSYPFSRHINITDLTLLLNGSLGSPAYPRMFGGQRAFDEPCPWP